MNRFYLLFFFFCFLNDWMNEIIASFLCVCIQSWIGWTVFCLFACFFFFSIRWKRQTGRLRWLTKHYLISLNFWIAQCGTTRIWVSQTKSTRMWNHFDCRRDRFFLPLCWFNTKWQRENVSKKKKKKIKQISYGRRWGRQTKREIARAGALIRYGQPQTEDWIGTVGYIPTTIHNPRPTLFRPPIPCFLPSTTTTI